MNFLKRTYQEIKRYPSAIVGMVIILFLIGVAVYALITIPYSEAIRLWRGGEEVWAEYPRNARPEWTNWFSRTKLAKTMILDTRANRGEKIVTDVPGGKEINITYDIDFTFDLFPQELTLFFTTQYRERQPHVSITWLTPDGRDIRIGELAARRTETYRFATDSRLVRRLRGQLPQVGLFADPDIDRATPLKGTYQLNINAYFFEEEDVDLDTKFVMQGQVSGFAGTDHRRRDLMVALLYGTPIALAFGLLAALGTTLTTMIIAAVGVWYSGIVDSAIQRITEVVLILPVLPILIMVGAFYDRSIWLMLGVVILLSIFGASIKTYRAIFLQVRESPYIEAARAYGAGNWRIIMNYLIPRIIPLLIPQLVVLIPSFVFLEATLAVLGLGDPVLPTWGKVIDDARSQGALFNGYYYWVLQPAFLLMLTGLGFSMVGFALDRIFNPRLRGL
jgi:peptide/nickel transport system permease protein